LKLVLITLKARRPGIMAGKTTSPEIGKEFAFTVRIGNAVFDDFFGKKLSPEGFSIEESAGGYFVAFNQMNSLSSDHDALGAERGAREMQLRDNSLSVNTDQCKGLVRDRTNGT
jgi:hypothetical protein